MGGGGGGAPSAPTVGKQLDTAVGAYQSLNSWQPDAVPGQPGTSGTGVGYPGLGGEIPGGGSLLGVEQNLDRSMSLSNTGNITNEIGGLSNYYFNNQLPAAEQAYQTQQTSQNQFMAGQYSSMLPGITSSIYNSTPGVQALTGAANQFTNAGVNSTLSGLEGTAQANSRSGTFNNTNNFVQNQLGTTSGTQAALNDAALGESQSASKQLANNGTNMPSTVQSLSAMYQAVNPNNPLSQALQSSAMQQLSLGSGLTQQQMDMAAQTSRAADSARGVFHSDGSAANEVLATDQYGQQLLQQREGYAGNVANQLNQNQQTANAAIGAAAAQAGTNQQIAWQGAQTANTFATNVGQLAQTEAQNKTSNAVNMANLDASITQNNQQSAIGAQEGALANQFSQQQLGVQQLQYLTGVGSLASNQAVQTLSTNNPSQSYASGGSSLAGVTPDVTPDFFNSLNLFGASQNASNQAFAAQQANYQSQQSQNTALVGAGIGAGASIAAGGLIAL